MILLFRSCRRTRMARTRSADVVVLGERRKQRLQAMAARPTAPQRLALRAKIVLAAGAGRSTAAIARELHVTEDTVRKWRHRFAVMGMPSLADAPRPGRPPVYDLQAQLLLSLIHISEPTRRTPISYAVFCLKN